MSILTIDHETYAFVKAESITHYVNLGFDLTAAREMADHELASTFRCMDAIEQAEYQKDHDEDKEGIYR